MNVDEYVENSLIAMFLQAQKQFGNAIKSYWFNDGDACPCCTRRKIDTIKLKGNEGEGISLNAFIYRPRGVLIGYFLCSRCATKIHRDAKKNPGQQTALHSAIEHNLSTAYKIHMNSMM